MAVYVAPLWTTVSAREKRECAHPQLAEREGGAHRRGVERSSARSCDCLVRARRPRDGLTNDCHMSEVCRRRSCRLCRQRALNAVLARAHHFSTAPCGSWWCLERSCCSRTLFGRPTTVLRINSFEHEVSLALRKWLPWHLRPPSRHTRYQRMEFCLGFRHRRRRRSWSTTRRRCRRR